MFHGNRCDARTFLISAAPTPPAMKTQTKANANNFASFLFIFFSSASILCFRQFNAVR
jgi:hypothetical protein